MRLKDNCNEITLDVDKESLFKTVDSKSTSDYKTAAIIHRIANKSSIKNVVKVKAQYENE